MLSRACFALHRLTPALTRGVPSWGARPLSTGHLLRSIDVSKPSTTGRTGLTGFLEEKTGVTGAWTLGVGLGAYIISKELYVFTNETVVAVIMGGVIYWMVQKMGGPVVEYIDARNMRIQNKFYDFHNSQIKEVEDAIADQRCLDGNLNVRHDIFQVLRENNVMQLEEEYRRRWHEVTTEITRRLDYQVAVEKLQKSFEHTHLVQWLERAVVENVMKQEDASITQCIKDLKKLAVA